jgi:predicted DNA-binding antitoxin AbrB/MazE fold protein
MQKTIEVVYKNGVLKPLEPVELEEGEKMEIRLEEKKKREIDFEQIKLKHKVSIKRIEELRSELKLRLLIPILKELIS